MNFWKAIWGSGSRLLLVVVVEVWCRAGGEDGSSTSRTSDEVRGCVLVGTLGYCQLLRTFLLTVVTFVVLMWW